MARLPSSLSAALQAPWRLLRSLGESLLGRDRFEALVRGSGLRALKYALWRSEYPLPGGGRLVYRPHDLGVVEEVFARRVYDLKDELRPGDAVVDAGGHIGAFAVYAALKVGPRGRVVVCEPAPDNLALLRENIGANALSQVRVLPCALGDREGEAVLHVPDSAETDPAANSLFAAPGRRPLPVPIRTLASVAEEERLSRVALLKIDVEGAELMTLQGAGPLLDRVSRIVLEIHPARVPPEKARRFLEARGFSCRTLFEAPLIVEARRRRTQAKEDS